MLGTKGLTEETVGQRKTYPGMAHFAGTGPAGMQCEKCRFYGYQRITSTSKARSVSGCSKFWDLTGHPGPAFPRNTAACKYFEEVNS